jgi:hypothetical protein
MRTVVFGTAVIAGVVWLSIAPTNPHSGLCGGVIADDLATADPLLF